MLKKILIPIVALVLLFVIVGALLPGSFQVERSIVINAKPEAVFGEVNNFKKWDAWSPWIARDQSIKNTFSGPESGVGAKVSWTSDESGAGSQEITKSESPSIIETKLDFGEMGSPNASWKFDAQGEGTEVTWSLNGEIPGIVGGYFALMMDKWVGADYEDGLSRLKKHVESLN